MHLHSLERKMKRSIYTIPMVSALMLTHSISINAAEAAENNWYFSPMLSYIAADSDRLADDDFGIQLGFGKKVADQWNLEISAVVDSLDFEAGSGEYKQKGLMVDGLYFFDRETDMQTYAVVGAGVMSTDIGVTDSTNPMINVGIGIMQQISDSGMKFRADIRYRMDMDDESISSEDEFNDVLLNVGLTIPFGSEKQSKPVQKASVVSIKDTDNDGVTDQNDKCPASAAGVMVDSRGCEVIKKAEVINNDKDNDGVLNSKDQCPSTAKGVNVDTKGCELQQSFVLKGVNFVTGSAELTESSKQVLDEVAATLIKNDGVNVEVAGYTDSRGNAGLNQRLSQSRAESVKAYLVTAGASNEQMTAKGYGVDSPIADNSTAEGRAENRRVEIHIIK